MKTHWIDGIVEDTRSALRALIDDERGALSDKVPVGKRLLTKREQLERFMRLTPQDHQALIDQYGPEEYDKFTEAQMKNARDLLGEDYASLFMAQEI